MMKRKLIYIVLAFLPLLGCQKEYAIHDFLSVTSHNLRLAKTPGSTHIMVYSTGAWTVSIQQDVEWASINKTSGEGMGEFVFSWSANYGVSRHVDVLVTREHKTERIHIIQAGSIESPYIAFGPEKVVLPRQAVSAFPVALNTNIGLSLDQFKAKAVYYDGAQPDTLDVGDSDPRAWLRSCKIFEDHVEFSAAEWNGTQDREATLVVYMEDSAGQETYGCLPIFQSYLDPVFELEKVSGDYYANSGDYSVGSQANNIWSLPGLQLSSTEDWVHGISVTEDGLTFSADENRSGAARSATISVLYVSGEHSARASFQVNQDAARLLSFADLRARVPGKLYGTDLIEGYIVSDTTSLNLCSSPQTGQFEFDRTENFRTAYLESVDGKYGFCLKFPDSKDNGIPRWSKVKVHLDGIKLERKMNPLRFTLSGITRDMIEIEEGEGGFDAVPRKEMRIAQLTDADVYTYVSLQDVEIMCKDGAYTNTSEGYIMKDKLNPLGADYPRLDVAPLLCSDPDGSSIFMLTNAAAPWRRTGLGDLAWNSCVPQGSGTLGGILVADDVAPVRWGNLGRYQIRPLTVEEIDLNGLEFSTTICEWTWKEPTLKPDNERSGCNIRYYEAGTDFSYDYNNPFLPVEDTPNGNTSTPDAQHPNLKGLVEKAALALKQEWWDYENNEGRYFDVEFNTSGISGQNLVVGITWGHGDASNAQSITSAPSHWKVLYSTGGDFQEVPSVGILKQRPCAWWRNPDTPVDATPGYTEHLIKLPPTCFGNSKVTVRFQVADLVSDAVPEVSESNWQRAMCVERGTLSSGKVGIVRIGTITVRYN